MAAGLRWYFISILSHIRELQHSTQAHNHILSHTYILVQIDTTCTHTHTHEHAHMNTYARVHVQAHVHYTRTHIHTHTRTHTRTNTHAQKHTHTHAHTHTHGTHTHTLSLSHTHIHANTHTHAHTLTHTHTRTHTHTHIFTGVIWLGEEAVQGVSDIGCFQIYNCHFPRFSPVYEYCNGECLLVFLLEIFLDFATVRVYPLDNQSSTLQM